MKFDFEDHSTTTNASFLVLSASNLMLSMMNACKIAREKIASINDKKVYFLDPDGMVLFLPSSLLIPLQCPASTLSLHVGAPLNRTISEIIADLLSMPVCS